MKDVNVVLNYVPKLWVLIIYGELWLYQVWGIAKRIILRNWKDSIIPDIKEQIQEMCNLFIFEKAILSTVLIKIT